MIHYEMMYIIDPAAEDGIDGVKQKIEGIITGREGSIVSFDRLGKKRLAYTIAKRQFGVYFLVNLKGDGRIVQALDQFLLLSPIVLRHIILAFTDKDLGLREATERIQFEESERMRLGGRPLGGKTEEELELIPENGSMPKEVQEAIDAVGLRPETPFPPRKPVDASGFYPVENSASRSGANSND